MQLCAGTCPASGGLICRLLITRGVTYLELTIDFELSTGIALPGGTKRLHQQNNRSIRRGAAQTIRSVF